MPDNRPVARKKRKPNKTAWKPGQSGNPKGAPKRGMSFKEAYEWALSLNAEDIAAILEAGGRNDLSNAFRQMPKGVELKSLMAARVVAAVMFDPQPGLVNHISDRTDGKVVQPFEWQEKVKDAGLDPFEIVEQVRAALAAATIEGLAEGESDG